MLKSNYSSPLCLEPPHRPLWGHRPHFDNHGYRAKALLLRNNEPTSYFKEKSITEIDKAFILSVVKLLNLRSKHHFFPIWNPAGDV